MPVLTVNSNVKASDVPSDFKQKATDVISKGLAKPSAYVAVHLLTEQDISFGLSDGPAALCNLVSIGGLSVDTNKRLSKALMELLERMLKVSPDRCYITFNNTPKGDIGYNKTTFDDLM